MMVSITELVGRNRQAVERLLGKAQASSIVKTNSLLDWTKAYYQSGEIEIIYIDNIADWIILHSKAEETIEELISFLGLNMHQGNLQYYGTIQYSNIHGLKEVTIFGNNVGNIETIFIKVFTKESE